MSQSLSEQEIIRREKLQQLEAAGINPHMWFFQKFDTFHHNAYSTIAPSILKTTLLVSDWRDPNSHASPDCVA